MSTKQIGVKPDSKEGDNIFDTYFNLIEKNQLVAASIDRPVYNTLVNSVTIVERNLLDASQRKKTSIKRIKILNDNVNKVLKEWLPILTLLSKNIDFIKALAYNFIGLSLIVNNNQGLDEQDIEKYSEYLSPSVESMELINSGDLAMPKALQYATRSNPYFEIVNNLHHSMGMGDFHVVLQKLVDANFKIFYNLDYLSYKISLNDIQEDTQLEQVRKSLKKYNIVELLESFKLDSQENVHTEWLIMIKTNNNHPDAVKFLNLIYTLSTAIKYIDDDEISVTIDDWGNGSKWAKLRVRFNNLIAQEETKELLDKARKATEAELFDKRIGEADKLRSEADKTAKEAANMPAKEIAEESNLLELEMKKLELFEKRIDIEFKIEDLKSKKIDNLNKLSNMIKDGLLASDSNFQIQINDLLYLKNYGTANEGASMNAIESRAALKSNFGDPGQSL